MNKKRIFFWMLLTLIPIMFLFILFEFVLSQFLPSPRLIYKFHQDRPVTFWPNMNHRYINSETVDGRVLDKPHDIYFRSNSLGFKDYEHSLQTDKPVFRVLLMGDSYVEAVQVLIQEQTGLVMERIAKSKGINLEVISMGMSGHGQAHHLANYKTVGVKFKPNLVIASFCSNDINDNEVNRPRFSLKDGELLPADPDIPKLTLFKKISRETFQKTETFFVLRNMVVKAVQLFAEEKNRKVAEMAAKGQTPSKKANSAETHEEHLDRIIGPKKQRELFIALVKEFENLIVKKNKTPLLHAIVSSGQYESIPPEFVEYLNWVENVLVSNNENKPVINFHYIFHDLYKTSGQRIDFKKDAHWNALGHQLVAQKFMDYILSNFDMTPYKL